VMVIVPLTDSTVKLPFKAGGIVLIVSIPAMLIPDDSSTQLAMRFPDVPS